KPLKHLFVVVDRLERGDAAGVAGSAYACCRAGESVQLADHAVRVRTAHVVALQEHLGAAAGTHDLAAQAFKTGVLCIRAHQQNNGAAEQQDLSYAGLHFLTPAGCQLACSPTAATVTAAGTVALTALGTNAIPVPKMSTITPSQTQETRGLTKALIV